jgi:DNA-binding transcriptional regulator YiaG
MTPDELNAFLHRHSLRQADLAWLCGVNVRHARSWCLGQYTLPQYARLLVQAYDEGLLTPAWLAARIDRPVP